MKSFEEEEAIKSTSDGWSFVFQQGAMLALMPIEEWLEAFDRADAIAPITDPTLYRDYIYSGKGEIIKDVLRGALVFKQAILKAQKEAKEKGMVEP
jgi:hypothetical protein